LCQGKIPNQLSYESTALKIHVEAIPHQHKSHSKPSISQPFAYVNHLLNHKGIYELFSQLKIKDVLLDLI